MTRSVHPAVRLGAVVLLASLAACQSDAGNTTDSSGAAPANLPPAAAAATPTDSAASAMAPAAAGGALLHPDSATREQLLAIPGITAAGADALVAGRPYTNMLAVDRVLAQHVTSEPARESVYTRLWKPLDLNGASKEEILLVPGVGPRMQHEFEEYRPYPNIARFRREIGKYVDSAEVVRLERYVTIRP
jgi:DNA uptake protein ComE-like DNA-binding protein